MVLKRFLSAIDPLDGDNQFTITIQDELIIIWRSNGANLFNGTIDDNGDSYETMAPIAPMATMTSMAPTAPNTTTADPMAPMALIATMVPMATIVNSMM